MLGTHKYPTVAYSDILNSVFLLTQNVWQLQCFNKQVSSREKHNLTNNWLVQRQPGTVLRNMQHVFIYINLDSADC